MNDMKLSSPDHLIQHFTKGMVLSEKSRFLALSPSGRAPEVTVICVFLDPPSFLGSIPDNMLFCLEYVCADIFISKFKSQKQPHFF